VTFDNLEANGGLQLLNLIELIFGMELSLAIAAFYLSSLAYTKN